MKKLTAILIALFLLLSFVPVLAEDTVPANVTDFSNTTPEELLQRWTQLGDTLRQNGAYPFPELQRNDTGYEVTALQTQLAALGYYNKEIVDNFGTGTYNALRSFEKASGLPVNGIAAPEDQQALYQAVAALSTTDVQTATGLDSSVSPDGLFQLWLEIGALLRTNGSYPYVELSKGDIGYEVTMLQTRLQQLGYYEKEIVDNFGTGTYNALRTFEKQNGLTVNGIASVEDQQTLFSETAAVYVQQATAKPNTTNDGTSGATQ